MCTQLELNEILKKMIKLYQQVYGESLCAIYLYGSYARGESTSESDIDIAAIAEGDRGKLQEQLKEVWNISSEIGLDYDVIISPTVIPHREFENFKNILPYYKNIVKEGVKLDE